MVLIPPDTAPPRDRPRATRQVRIWLIRKRFRRHTIAVVAYLRIARTLRELRARKRVHRAFQLATLLTNAPMLSLKRARELVRRRAAVRLQAAARRQIVIARQHRSLWATFLLQRTARGMFARSATRAPLAAARELRRLEALERSAEEEAAKKAASRAELERVRQLANAANAGRLTAVPPGGGRFHDASRYASRHRAPALPHVPPPPAEGASDAEVEAYQSALAARRAAEEAAGAHTAGGAGAVPMVPAAALAACEARVAKLEEQLAAVLRMMETERERVRMLEEKVSAPGGAVQAGAMSAADLEAHTRSVLDRLIKERERGGALLPGGGPSGSSRRQSTSAGAGAKGTWSVGLLDLLGMAQPRDGVPGAPGGADGRPGAADGRAGGASAPRAPRASVGGGGSRNIIPPPNDALSGLQAAARAIQLHFGADADGNLPAGADVSELGNDAHNKEIAVLVRGQLCTALSRVMLHGFKSFKLIGRYHIWDFVQSAADAVRAVPRPPADSLTAGPGACAC